MFRAPEMEYNHQFFDYDYRDQEFLYEYEVPQNENKKAEVNVICEPNVSTPVSNLHVVSKQSEVSDATGPPVRNINQNNENQEKKPTEQEVIRVLNELREILNAEPFKAEPVKQIVTSYENYRPWIVSFIFFKMFLTDFF